MRAPITYTLLFATACVIAGCDGRVETTPPEVEKKETTIVNPPADMK